MVYLEWGIDANLVTIFLISSVGEELEDEFL